MATRVTGVLLSLLTDIADYRIILLSQIGYLHFSGKRSARRRMQQFVVVLPGPTARGGGRPEKVYGVSRTGLDLINSERPNSPQLGFDQVCGEKLGHQTGHQLLLNWCRVHLIHLTRQLPRVEHRLLSSNSALALDEESGLCIVSDNVSGPEDDSPVRFTPDAAFILTDTQQPKSVLFFLQVDMGTQFTVRNTQSASLTRPPRCRSSKGEEGPDFGNPAHGDSAETSGGKSSLSVPRFPTLRKPAGRIGIPDPFRFKK